ncbi:MAG TPA: EAL domain-containing protein [Thermoanaerobaculia bacterium]|nr:EAL domain-containing protein [Thermoanaerobaculia bacterium]
MSEHSALETLLRPGGITPLFQPVFRVGSDSVEMHGVECLSRGPKGTNLESAKVLFDYVRLKREEPLVDRACISAALEEAASLPPDILLNINVHASTLGRNHGFLQFFRATAAKHSIAPTRLTIEIVEHAPPWDNEGFLSALDTLRNDGVKVALDDIGLGQSNFKMLVDVCPDYLKLDRYFVEGCETDGKRQAVIAAVAQLASRFGAEVVAEGVTSAETVEALRGFGITLMQGFHFAEPMGVAELMDTFSPLAGRRWSQAG